MPLRSATLPPRHRSPSPDYTLPQDCAFPPFPTSRAQSASRKASSDRKKSIEDDRESLGRKSPPNVRGGVGDNILKRMNSIAPGPFNIDPHDSSARPGLKRAETVGNNKINSFTRVNNGASHIKRPSTADPGHARNSSIWSSLGGSRSVALRAEAESDRQSTLLLLKPSQLDDNRSIASTSVSESETANIVPLRQDARSQTFPIESQSGSNDGSESSRLARRPSEPVRLSHTRRPSVAAANRPLHEIGSTSSFKPHRSMPSRNASPTMAEDTSRQQPVPPSADVPADRNDPRLSDAPPVPPPVRNVDYSVNSLHTPTESISSNGSSSTDARTSSSRSSPPLSGSSYYSVVRPSDLERPNDSANPSILAKEDAQQARRGPPRSFSRPLYPRSIETSLQTENSLQVDPSPISPPTSTSTSSPSPWPHSQPMSPQAIEGTLAEPNPQSSQSPRIPELTSIQSSVASPTSPPILSPRERQPKGNCRGCKEPIKGKSVSSADGRLTGRFHKQCFVCKTCKELFPTADFYVLQDDPYCFRHYHELNGSMCTACDSGIEGQYLETEAKQKFHPQCFTCQAPACNHILGSDYFELNGKILCEQHATMPTSPSQTLLSPGRRNPAARRSTRLMMMDIPI